MNILSVLFSESVSCQQLVTHKKIGNNRILTTDMIDYLLNHCLLDWETATQVAVNIPNKQAACFLAKLESKFDDHAVQGCCHGNFPRIS